MKNKLIIFSSIFALIAVIAFFLFHQSTQGPDRGVETATASSAHSDDLESQMTKYYQDVQGYFVKPKNISKSPGVVLIHDEGGLNDSIKSIANKLAADGFFVLAVDLFSQDNAENINQVIAVANLKSAISFLHNQGSQNIGVAGFGFGGYEALLLSVSDNDQELDAAVIYYGKPIINEDLLIKSSSPILGLYARDDDEISIINVEKMESSLTSMGHNNDIVIYPGTSHGFADPTDKNYNQENAENSFAKMLLFFEENLKLTPIP